ncbi:neutral protease NprB [Nibrella viscosa]|uniref:Neutral metalloproteinase n=2 Tax=Nibrella viscosa TaxID=1084524 RepID=A0ABP8K1L1_9BACT
MAAPSFTDLANLDPETAARQHLQLALASQSLPQFLAPNVKGIPSEFRILSTETQPLTDTRTVKFRQTFNKIPVYGSLVTVELDNRNELVAVNSALAQPSDVQAVAQLSPAQAVDIVQKLAGYGDQPFESVPRLCYYFDEKSETWRLVYLLEDVWQFKQEEHQNHEEHGHASLLMDYFIDAETGEPLAIRPRTPSMAAFQDTGIDELGLARPILCMEDVPGSGQFRLFDSQFNVHTFDFGFQDIFSGNLPGNIFLNPPIWNASAVSAHANAVVVASYLQQVLRRNGFDNLGSPLVSSVNCIDRRQSPDGRQWQNAAWIPLRKQMVYGQRLLGGRFRSFAAGLDVVAHEIFHGVTDKTARLEYAFETGALNESYSDIFGILVSNRDEPNIANWNWEMGEDVDGSGVPIRNFRNPAARNQPMHMDNFLRTTRDHGGVHTNSGIHNFAAFQIMTARNQQGTFLFSPDTLGALFYLALTQYLSRTSLFSDSLRALVLVARTLFRHELTASANVKIRAIVDAFDAVGVR